MHFSSIAHAKASTTKKGKTFSFFVNVLIFKDQLFKISATRGAKIHHKIGDTSPIDGLTVYCPIYDISFAAAVTHSIHSSKQGK